MGMLFKVLFLSSALVLTASCQDTLDTTSQLTKEQSIKQMMVGIYPENQKIFKQALKTIYDIDQKLNPNIALDESIALTDKKLKGKTIEDILHLSSFSKKEALADSKIRAIVASSEAQVVASSKLPKEVILVKTNFIVK